MAAPGFGSGDRRRTSGVQFFGAPRRGAELAAAHCVRMVPSAALTSASRFDSMTSDLVVRAPRGRAPERGTEPGWPPGLAEKLASREIKLSPRLRT